MSLFRFYLSLLTTATLCWVFVVSAPRLSPFDEKWLPSLGELHAQISSIDTRKNTPGYDRDNFGSGWQSPKANVCNARIAAISRQSTPYHPHHPRRTPPQQCRLPDALFFDPYTQKTSDMSSLKVEVDHVFPLAAAWDLGAHSWDEQQRIRFANDPINLIATEKTVNRDKSDSLPSKWMPPSPAAHCWYAKRLLFVAVSYDLALPAQDLKTARRACRFTVHVRW